MKDVVLRSCLCALALLCGNAHGLPDDADQPIRISADRAEIDDATGIASYYGDVRMDQGSMRVTAETLRIHTENEAVIRITAEGAPDGEPARFQQLPEPDADLVRADARTIVYFTQEERIELDGAANLVQAEDVAFSGEHLTYQIREGRVAADSGNTDGRVNFTITPDRIGAPGSNSD